ncbi:unnamed protein product [Blepharisma stoltei]|uniref:Uncharacterized protein n=1 Tax=Blepharisma stoltei TaxID=1481888 RepID=A0AAU9J1I7_9CILI|nr:unnamed protein product [Blepharisma stoltei]
MALLGVTNPEKLIIPLFFNKKEQGELSRLFRPDSVLKHLMDQWKEDTVKAGLQEDISLMKYLYSRLPLVKSYLAGKLKIIGQSFEDRIEVVGNLGDIFERLYEEEFRRNLDSIENEILISTLKYYAILEEHKRLSQVKYEHIKQAVGLKKDIEEISRKLQEYSAVLQFETWGAVKLIKLDEYNPQLSRCEKALQDNIKSSIFQGTNFSSLKLCHAFKIENQINLKPFEQKLKESQNSVLKGMFLSVRKKTLPSLVLLGAKTNEYVNERGIVDIREKYLRIPESIANKIKSETYIKSGEGLPEQIYMSTSSTLEKDRKKLTSDKNCMLILVLCRVILPKNKQEAGYDQNTQEFLITDFSTIYPEYILICTKEKSYFEVIPEKSMIIPAKLMDLSYSTPLTSNKMNTETFYSSVTKALDQSQQQRRKLKSDLISQCGSFNTNLNVAKCQSLAIDSRKPFIFKLRSINESLKRELLNVQKFNETLRKLAKVRTK